MERKLVLFASPGRVAEHSIPQLLKEGWDASISYRAGGNSERVAKRIQETCGADRIDTFEADISSPEGSKEFLDKSLEKYLKGSLSRVALINVASQFPRQEDFDRWSKEGKIEEADWKYFNSNFEVMRNMSLSLLGYREKSKKPIRLDIISFADERSQRYFNGDLIHPFSDLGKRVLEITLAEAKTKGTELLKKASLSGRDYNPYLLSKLLIGYATRELALDYGGKNVRINAIAPGVMSASPNDPEEQAREYAKQATLTGSLKGHKIASDAIFYLLEMSSNMTGNILFPDGGMHLLWKSKQKK